MIWPGEAPQWVTGESMLKFWRFASVVVPSISSVSGTSTDEGINPLDDDVDIDVIDWCCPRCCDRVLIARIGRYLGAEFCLLGSGPFCAGFLLERKRMRSVRRRRFDATHSHKS